MITLLFSAPIALTALLWLFRTKRTTHIVLFIHAAIVLISTAGLALKPGFSGLPEWAAPYFKADPAAVFFLCLMALVYAASAVYAVFYFNGGVFEPFRDVMFTMGLLWFVTAMSGAILSTHFAFFWVFLELTTLTTAGLIYHDRTKPALEAAWKYIFICSIGITLAFVGIILLSLGSREIGSLFFRDLTAASAAINPFWLKTAFAFILIGYGTKIGVAPIHAWLPDAHSEAPSPVSALLSGTLLNTALIGFFRFYQLITLTDSAEYARHLTLGIGFLSLLISGAFMLRTVNYKRMLAYSSIENMGLIFIGLGLGGPGIVAAMLQTAAHSLSKTGLFLTSGNIMRLYGTRRIDEVNGLLTASPATGWLWICSFLAIAGMPPFPAFVSKFLLFQAAYLYGIWTAVLLLILLLIAFTGMSGAVMRMTLGIPAAGIGPNRISGWGFVTPQVVLLVLSLIIGLSVPGPVLALIERAAGMNP